MILWRGTLKLWSRKGDMWQTKPLCVTFTQRAEWTGGQQSELKWVRWSSCLSSLKVQFVLLSSLMSLVRQFAAGNDIFTVKLLSDGDKHSPFRAKANTITYISLSEVEVRLIASGSVYMATITYHSALRQCFYPDFFISCSVCGPAWTKFPQLMGEWIDWK